MALLPGSPAIGAGSSTAAVTGVAYAASVGATTVLVNATSAISAGEIVQIDGQNLHVTNTQAGDVLLAVPSLVASISPGDLVRADPQGTPIGTVVSGAVAGATMILVNLFGNLSPFIEIDSHVY
jgi:hypothetical protein